MPTATVTRSRPRPLRFASLFPAWDRPAPVAHFMMEELLEARRESGFPTNSRGPDEEVNVYLAHLLTAHLSAPVTAGAAPLTVLPGRDADASERWRRNGDHRLLALGLYGWGDLARRRRVPFGSTEEESRRRDLTDGRTCYELAARTAPASSRPLLRKLALGFDGYVHVLEALGRGRFGFGARLSAAALRDLVEPTSPAAPRPTPPAPTVEPRPPTEAEIDAYLDRLIEHERAPSDRTKAALDKAARRAGIGRRSRD